MLGYFQNALIVMVAFNFCYAAQPKDERKEEKEENEKEKTAVAADGAEDDYPTCNSNSCSAELTDITKLDYDVYCKFQPSTYQCSKKKTLRRYHYDLQLQECIRVDYGHCENAYNNFESSDTCKQNCQDVAHHPHGPNLTENVYCYLQPEFGDCNSYNPMFYFDINTFTCKGFAFSGCGGNYNRFPNAKVCLSVCSGVVVRKDEEE